jgi:hypothetical protein
MLVIGVPRSTERRPMGLAGLIGEPNSCGAAHAFSLMCCSATVSQSRHVFF